MRSYQELAEASGYANRPSDFEDLLRILDGEIRLITPADLAGLEVEDGSQSAASPGQKYYQLTHDYLVAPLREWLTRKQNETRRGRAELRLAERSGFWNAWPENRHLSPLWEYVNILWYTKPKDRTDPQRSMMRRARQMHLLHVSAAAVIFVVVVVAGLAVLNWWRLPGTLVVSNAPPGARITVAGQSYEVVGERYEIELRAGAYQIRMSAPTHESETFGVLVERGKGITLRPHLLHNRGWLSAEYDPLGSEIEVDGKAYGSRIVLQLDTGSHSVRTWRNGYFDSPLIEVHINKNAITQTRLPLDKGIVWQQRSQTIQSMAIPICDAAGRIVGIVHDELQQVVCRSPRDGSVLWKLPFGSQRVMKLIDLGGDVGEVLIIGNETAAEGDKQGTMNVLALRPIPDSNIHNSKPEILWRWRLKVTPHWTTERGLLVAAVPDLDGDGAREVTVAGRDGKMYVIDGRGGKEMHSIELLNDTAKETPHLHSLRASPSTLIAFHIEPGNPNEARKPYPKPLVIGCVNVKKGAVVNKGWRRALDMVTRIAAIDIDGDGTADIYWSHGSQWQILDAATGDLKAESRQFGQPFSSDPYFADVDGDGKCEIIEIPPNEGEPMVARRIHDGRIVWHGPADALPNQPAGLDRRLYRSPRGELLIFCRSSLVALNPANGKLAWRVDGTLEGVVVGQWDNIGEDEIFVGVRGRGIVCLAADGSPKWTLRMSLDVLPLTTLPDIDGDGLNELVINKHAALIGLIRGPRVLWKQEATGPLLASPQVVDFDGDGQMEVCQVGRWGGDDYCRCFNGRNGAVRWSIKKPFPNNRAQAVYDWDGDVKKDYVVLGYATDPSDLHLYVFRGADGRLMGPSRRIDDPHDLYTTPGIGEFNGDDHPDVAAVRWDRKDIIAIDGKRGEIYWRFDTRAENQGGVAVGDIDGDGRDDIVATTSYREKFDSSDAPPPKKGMLIALRGRKVKNTEQQDLWRVEVGLPMRSIPLLNDLDSDGTLEILAISQRAAGVGASSRSRLNVVSNKGKLIWTAFAAEATASIENVHVIGSPKVARIDGEVWIIAPMGNDGVVAFDYGLRQQVWQSEAGVRVISTPVVDDLDGDGSQEVVVTTVDGQLLVLDLRTGHRLWQIKIGRKNISGAPAVGDLNGDGVKDIVVADHGFTLTAINGFSTRAARARLSAGSNANR